MAEEEVKIPSKDELLDIIDGKKEGNPDDGVHIPGEEITDIQKEAMLHGWNPEGVDGKRNLTAEEFMDRKPLYDDIRAMKRELRKQKEGMAALLQERDVIRQKAREDTIKELQAQKIEALDVGDNKRAVELDDQIQDEKAALAVEKTTTPEPSGTNTEFDEWVEENPWYNQNEEMKRYADLVGRGIAGDAANGTMTRSEIYAEVTKEVKARFPTNFAGHRRGQPSPVEGAQSGRANGSRSKKTIADLPEEAQLLAPTIMRATGMSEEDYIKSYESV